MGAKPPVVSCYCAAAVYKNGGSGVSRDGGEAPCSKLSGWGFLVKSIRELAPCSKLSWWGFLGKNIRELIPIKHVNITTTIYNC